MADVGRPPIDDDTYKQWLSLLEPFLLNGSSLYYSIKCAGLLPHKSLIFQKYKLNDWFMEKIDDYRREPGELVNVGIVTQVRAIVNKIKLGEVVTSDETNLMKFYAQFSRSAQPFFVNRFETAAAKPIEEILDQLEGKEDTINDVADKIAEQVVEVNPSIQNQE